MRSLIPALLAFTLAACTAGPDYHLPTVVAPATFREGSANAAPPPDRWWEGYGDPTLVMLVDRALAANPDIAIAEARIRQARARTDEAAGGRLPQVSFQGATMIRELSRNGEQLANLPTNLVSPNLDYTVYRAGFDASWELDLAGRNRRQVEAAQARYDSAAEERNDVLVRVAGDVARAYVEYRTAQRRIEVATLTLEAARQTAEMTAGLVRAGEEARTEAERAASAAEQNAAALPPLRADAASALYRLDVLLGAQPGTVAELVGGASRYTLVMPAMPEGLPSDLLRRRPDIRRAERELAAATADVGVAVADLYPRFSLTGSLGLESLSLGSLADKASHYGSLIPGFSLPIFDGGRRRAVVRRQEAMRDEALASYQATVVRALSDVEVALLRLREDRSRSLSLERESARLTTALDLTRRRYRSGEASMIEVLEAQRQVSASDDRVAQSRAAIIIDAVSLDKALGGGWGAKH